MSPRRKVKDKWPRPADSPLDRARSIARSYRDALLKVDPSRCYQLDAEAERRGQGWVAPQQAQWELDDLLTADELVDCCCIQPRTIDTWISRGLKTIETVDGRRFRYGDILDYQAQQRLRRAAIRKTTSERDHCGTVAAS